MNKMLLNTLEELASEMFSLLLENLVLFLLIFQALFSIILHIPNGSIQHIQQH